MWDNRTTMARGVVHEQRSRSPLWFVLDPSSTSPRSDAIPHPSNWDPQGRHGQEGVLGRKKSEEGSFGDDVEGDETKKQCEEEKNCPKVDCPKVTSEVDLGNAKMTFGIPRLDPTNPETLKSTATLANLTTKNGTNWTEMNCRDPSIENSQSIPMTGCADEKVNGDDGEEGSGDEEEISWLRHAAVVLESEGSERREWSGEHVAVEGEKEGQQGPKLEVALELWEEDEREQKESEKLPLRDPTVEVQEARWSEQQVVVKAPISRTDQCFCQAILGASTSPRSDAIPHPSNWDPQGRHGQEGVLGRKRSEEGSFGDDEEGDETKKQCEEEKNCPKVDCPKVTSEVDLGNARMKFGIPRLDPTNPGTWKSTAKLANLTTKNGTNWTEMECRDPSIENSQSIPMTGCADEKVNGDDGEEGSGQREWSGEHVVVEGEKEGQQGPELEVVLEQWEEDEREQKESEKLPLRDPTVEVQEAKWSEQQVQWLVEEKE
eukprot:s1136_g11.t1